MPSSNPKSINFGANAHKTFPSDDASAKAKGNANAVTEALAATTGDAGKEQGDKAKAAIVKGA